LAIDLHQFADGAASITKLLVGISAAIKNEAQRCRSGRSFVYPWFTGVSVLNAAFENVDLRDADLTGLCDGPANVTNVQTDEARVCEGSFLAERDGVVEVGCHHVPRCP
jgi:hypothetical protein